MSTLNVESISHPTSGSNVTINGITPASTGSLGLRNLVINGAMQVAQRGTSSTASNYGTVDRFACYFSGGAQTQTQETLTSGTPYDEGFRYFLRLTNTTSSTGAGDSRQIMVKLEGQDIAQSGWNYTSSTSYITLSFWVRASVSQEYYGYMHTQDGTQQIYPFSLGTLTAGTWTKITKTVPGNSNITMDNDNGQGFRIVIAPFWGTDATDSGVSVDTWAAYANGTRTPDYTNTWAATTSATFDLTGVQLEVGSVATPFEHRSFEHELNLCRRYYQSNFPYGEAIGTNSTYVSSFIGGNISGGPRGYVDYYQPMRATPSITFWNNHRNIAGNDNALVFNTSGTWAGTTASTTINACGFQFIPALGNSGNTYYFNWEASAEL